MTTDEKGRVMMNKSLTNDDSWSDGVWLRTRSGPRPRGAADHVDVSIWHRVRDLDGWNHRPRTVCGYGPRDGFSWPAGGSRWEIARPQTFGTLPGAVCERCRIAPARYDREPERLELDVPDIEELARRVAAHLSGSEPSQSPPDAETPEGEAA